MGADLMLLAAPAQQPAVDTMHVHWWVWAATLGGLALLLLLATFSRGGLLTAEVYERLTPTPSQIIVVALRATSTAVSDPDRYHSTDQFRAPRISMRVSSSAVLTFCVSSIDQGWRYYSD